MRRKTPYIRPGSGFEWSTYTQARDHRQTVVSDTHVFSPTLVNIFTFGHQTDYFIYGEQEKGVTPLTGADAVKAIGLQGTNAKGYQAMGFPQMTVQSLSTLYNGDGYDKNLMNNDGANTFTDTLTWSKGKHVLKVGGEFRHYWWFSGSLSNGVYGSFNFNGSIAGNGFAEFLLGVPYTATRLNPIPNRPSHDKQLGGFINDTFKVTPKLTLDYGLRWDWYGIPTYDDGLMYNFDLASGKVVVPQDALSKVNPLYPKNIPITAGQVVPNVPWHNIHPRFSAAYRLTNKTVLRGGYGEYTDSWSYTQRRPGASPFQLSETYNNVISVHRAAVQLPQPVPGESLFRHGSQPERDGTAARYQDRHHPADQLHHRAANRRKTRPPSLLHRHAQYRARLRHLQHGQTAAEHRNLHPVDAALQPVHRRQRVRQRRQGALQLSPG